MSKIAIITDSNSGITQAEGEELGIIVIPMPFTIAGTDYLEDINLTQEEFYTKLNDDEEVSTSQPSPGTLMDLWDDTLKNYDEIVYIPMSSGLSSSCSSAMSLAMDDDYEGKVFVVDNQRISVTMRNSVLDAIRLAKEGKSGAQIKEILEKDKFNSSIYIMLDTLYYLKKGGRITPAAAALGTILRIKPVLQIQGEKLDSFAKARTSSQGQKIMLNAIKDDAEKRFGGLNPDNVRIDAAFTHDTEKAAEWKKMIEETFPGFDVHMDPLSLSVSCHIGPGALAVTITKILK
ncbi:MAG: DegV family protein [Butyrivibrio sp.]|uniref:DegV family protein n=1 Tax=Butyrivibrio sp. TaxID=28121 RepID=UPI0025F456A8|nr:DegV family protein [Butyrivibrio sp.]MCR5770040.1 DegV family protein [Butyrivibrio sp.]